MSGPLLARRIDYTAASNVAHAFATAELDPAITHTFGGHTPCVELDLGIANE